MSLTTSEMTPADIRACTCNNDGNGYGGGWGGDWGAWIILFLIFGMFGWGGGFGGFGGFGGGASGALTRGDLCMDMNFNDVQNGVRNISDAVNTGFANLNSTICHQQYDTAMLVNGVNNNISNGFHSVDNSICTLGYQNAQLINGVQRQVSDCCCENRTGQMQLGNSMERGFCDVNYAQATNTNAIIQNAHNDTDRVLAKLDAMEMARKDETIFALREKLSQADLRASQADQNNYLVNMLRPCPTPAYITCNPWASQAAYGSCGSGCGNGCGCNGY